MTRALAAAIVACLALAACTTGGAPTSGNGISSGGSAARMGQNYCHTVPTDLNERSRWNNLCFSSR